MELDRLVLIGSELYRVPSNTYPACLYLAPSDGKHHDYCKRGCEILNGADATACKILYKTTICPLNLFPNVIAEALQGIEDNLQKFSDHMSKFQPNETL